MRNRIPSLSFFLDASGRFSRSARTPIAIAGLAIETDNIEAVRESLLTVTKGSLIKWKDAQKDVQSAKKVFRLMVKRQITGIVKIFKKDRPEWNKYWEVGNSIYELGVKKAQEAIPYAKASTTLKYHLYGIAIGELAGFYLFRQRHLLPHASSEVQEFHVHAVCDSDIQGDANVRVFQRIFQELGDLPKVREATRTKPVIEVSLKTEEQEPLLLLADYLAGFNYSYAVYGEQVADEREKLLREISRIIEGWPGYAYKRMEESFRETYLIDDRIFDQVLPKAERERLQKSLAGSQPN